MYFMLCYFSFSFSMNIMLWAFLMWFFMATYYSIIYLTSSLSLFAITNGNSQHLQSFPGLFLNGLPSLIHSILTRAHWGKASMICLLEMREEALRGVLSTVTCQERMVLGFKPWCLGSRVWALNICKNPISLSCRLPRSSISRSKFQQHF